MIIQGVTLKGTYVVDSLPYVTANLVLNLDAGLSSSFSGNTTWVDTISGLSFTLSGSPTFSSNNGGYLNFVPASSQYAYSPNQSFGSLQRWTVEVWHYFTNTNSGGLPCIVTELFPASTSQINFSLGSDTTTGLQNGWYNGWHNTSAYTLTPNTWNHIVGTANGVTGNINLYVNNVQVEGTNFAGTLTSSGGGIRLMRRWDNADYWGGRLATVRIYNTEFGNTQINTNYQALRSRFGL
jgi:hypothetical protein